ncbi:hypothetical protein BDV25DRAFT_136933 [Aspergillus avenaceus]|uniref:Uncharacterized protein n=1 Tax=Aspergillus avenaceus TaxID=36643 RepID=A0A5N6U3W6_ASPAV|nr:hypothetical protein BDV25DRAFT_136933 [Aspergillus avenaceus]
MRSTALITASMALAGFASAQCAAGATADCKKGFNYCAKTLRDRGEADSAINVALKAADHGGMVGLPGLQNAIIFHCNDDYTLTVVKSCESGSFCVDGGWEKDDHCGDKWRPF